VTALLLAAALAGQVDATGVHRAVAAQKGRPVLVNLWATWCAPCVEEFPALVALARDRKDVAVVSISIDDSSDRKAVETFVARQDPPFPVYLKANGDDEAFIDGVDREWSGVVPVTLIFDRSGKRVALLQGEHSKAEIEKALEEAKR
jgi:thiol-disulfide isomerase/thioredoxin